MNFIKHRIAAWALRQFFKPMEIWLIKRAISNRLEIITSEEFKRIEGYRELPDDIAALQSIDARLDKINGSRGVAKRLAKRSNELKPFVPPTTTTK